MKPMELTRPRLEQAHKRFVCEANTTHEVFVRRELAEGRRYVKCKACGGVMRKRSHTWRD